MIRRCLPLILVLLCGAPAPAQEPDLDAKVAEARKLVLMRQHAEGRAALAEVIAADAGHFGAHFWLASSFLMEKQPAKAVPHWCAASDADSTHFIAAFEAGTGHLRERQYEAAVPYLKRAIAAIPG
ncbi:MAG: tetratricopeptide repeat protein, partial [Planctomycetota bacterium]